MAGDDPERDRALEEYKRGWLEADRDRKAAFGQLVGVELKLTRQRQVNETRKRQIQRLQRQLREAEERKRRAVEDLEAVVGGLNEQVNDLTQQLATSRAMSALVPAVPVIPERDYGHPLGQFIYTDPALHINGEPINGVFSINHLPNP